MNTIFKCPGGVIFAVFKPGEQPTEEVLQMLEHGCTQEASSYPHVAGNCACGHYGKPPEHSRAKIYPCFTPTTLISASSKTDKTKDKATTTNIQQTLF